MPSFSSIPNATKTKWWMDPGLRRNVGAAFVLYFGSFSIGYDGSYLNALQSLPTWNAYFDNPSGVRLSLIGAMPYMFMALTSPLYGLLNDWKGRKYAVALSAILIIVGALVGTFAKNITTLLVGRAIAGPGGSLALTTSTLLVAEILHPRLRPIGTSLVVTWFYSGSIISSWIGFGVVAADWQSDWSWRLPTLLQIIGPIIMLAGLPLVPESPRWQIAHGRLADAHAMLAKHHANGKMDDELVLFQLDEITSSIEREKQQAGFSALFSTPGNRKRLAVIVISGVGSQLNGVGLFSYYLAPVLKTVGVTSSLQQTAINASLSIWNFFFAIAGSTLVERAGRRPLWLISTFGMLACFACIIGLSGRFATTGNKNIGLASIPFMFIGYAFYDIAWTPLIGSYVVEILPFSIRGTGMAISAFSQYSANVASQWINPIGLESISWKFYFVYLALLTFFTMAIYFLFPETRGLSLEEVSLIFDQPGNASLEERKNAVDAEFKHAGSAAVKECSEVESV
ncbi:hypothetical protein JCM8547_006614 [Rhodosporidiobolus lusitaniae]